MLCSALDLHGAAGKYKFYFWLEQSMFACMYSFGFVVMNIVDQFETGRAICFGDINIRYLLRFFDCLAHPNLRATFATDQK